MKSFFRFSKKTQKTPIFDFSKLNCDLHSHLIPNIDDGASSLKDSVFLVKGLSDLGFKKIITTPHIMKGVYDNNVDIINSGLNKLRKEIRNENIDIEIQASAEYYFDFHFFELAKKRELISFNNNFILFELSFLDSPLNLYDVIFELQLMGYNVILAHPERYSFFNKEDYKKLKSKNIFFQINLLSLIGYYNEEVQKKSEYLIDSGMVDFAGTDLHNSTQLEFYHKVQTTKYYHALFEKNNLLNNTL